MFLTVNSQSTDYPTVRTVADLARVLGLDGAGGVALAVGSQVVSRPAWEAQELREGDTIHILRAVQGG